ncbi:hypothetical protein [Streptacidiphilus neutrinimicus]|uniref:hypothetical protein n=1 Tax=Streptacidiphilus neutrinimicus TaxID=105420 RepID=UPI000693A519|nr:hypothetical protein [Streptacidiphilus neutrinimicus]
MLAQSPNRVARTNDPTAHAEILTTRDAYEPHYVDDRKYFELANFYEEFAKSREERRLPMRCQPQEDAVELCREWQQSNGGERRAAGSPTAG